jgi:hypothetical protein
VFLLWNMKSEQTSWTILLECMVCGKLEIASNFSRGFTSNRLKDPMKCSSLLTLARFTS